MSKPRSQGVWAERIGVGYRWEGQWSALQHVLNLPMPDQEKRDLDYILNTRGLDVVRETGLYALDDGCTDDAVLVDESWLEKIRKSRTFDHSQAISLLNALGEINSERSDGRYWGDFLNFIFPSAFWSEVLSMKRALWLLDNIGSNPSAVIERLQEHAFQDDKTGLQQHYFELSWPGHLCHQFCEPNNPPPIAFEPELVGPITLENLVNTGLSRSGVFNEIRFDPTTGGFERRPLGRSPGAALWELISRKTAGFKAPIKCQVCGVLVEAKRKTRKYCSPACCKQAQRLGLSETRAAG